MLSIASSQRKEGGTLARHRNGYKFTEKRQSGRGILAFLFALASIGIFGAVVFLSYQSRGNGSMYLGSAGVASMVLSVVAFFLAIGSLREENSFRLFPYLATVTSFFAAGIWIATYTVGFM